MDAPSECPSSTTRPRRSPCGTRSITLRRSPSAVSRPHSAMYLKFPCATKPSKLFPSTASPPK
jgi:hypothetical protein